MTKRLLAFLMGASMLVALLFGSADVEVTAGLFDSPLPEPPVNDDFVNAIGVSDIPFSHGTTLEYATLEPLEPIPECAHEPTGSIWYAFTPSESATMIASTGSFWFDTYLGIYTGALLDDLTEVISGCGWDMENRLVFQASAGTTYYIQVGGTWGQADLVDFHLETLPPPPPNDDFASALGVSGIPFTDYATTEGATLEPFELVPGCAYDPTGSIWYAFTPSASESVMVDLQYVWFDTYVGVYTGNSLDNLTEISSGCGWGNRLAFQAIAGETYYIQAGGMWGQASPLTFRLVPTPPPYIYFWYDPGSPSIYATVQFNVDCWDDANIGCETYEWDFGDGTTADGCCPTHNYEADGEYTVELVATTYDGRTGSASRTVHVETHDVAITEFRTPNRAEVGETHRIVVGVSNRGLYDEDVTVALYKSVPGDYWTWESIGDSDGFVPAHKANRTVDFEFSYTFTAEDAEAKKVSFRAVANLWPWPGSDATPGNNEAISLPTLIRPLH